MNRPAVGPQSLRGLPNGFPNQQPLGPSRAPAGRLTNGKMPSNGATWAFGGVPMGTAGLQNQRPGNGSMASFAQSIGGSQPATPLDLSEFPSLSNNPSQNTNPGQSTWAMPTGRPLGQATSHRSQQALLPSQQQTLAQQQTQQQQDDLFASSSQLPSSQGGFRFGGQNPVGQSSQSQENAADDFPPLSRNVNGDIGQDRLGLLQNVGFGGQSSNLGFGAGIGGSQTNRNNGLLNALSSSSSRTPSINPRDAGAVGPTGPSTSNTRGPIEPSHQSPTNMESDSAVAAFGRSSQPPGAQTSSSTRDQTPLPPMSSQQGGPSQPPPQPNAFDSESTHGGGDDNGPNVEDPLPGMSDIDRYGLKGLLAMLKGPYPDQAALTTGVDINALGLDLNSTERLSETIWSPFDDGPARPDIPQFNLPECYQVHNVQPIDNKLSNFSDETLMFMFYTCPGDVQQMIAANELTNRNWRYHKKLQLWLTKDEMMVPVPVGAGTERGYYIFFDPKLWIRERREFLLNYVDLEAVPTGNSGPMA